jgi:hypothetical protein
VVGGKLELFGNITDMISQWKGMEVKEVRSGDDQLLYKRGRKRLSKAIRTLSGTFEEGEEGHRSQPDVECKGEMGHISKVSFSNFVNVKEDKNSKKNAMHDSISPLSRQLWINQSRDIPGIWREDNLGTK